jgi:rhodanese-related sulfurtransferase
MIAANVVRGDAQLAQWEDVDSTGALILDVREPSEFKKGHLEKAVNIPLPELRARLDELPLDREIWAYCRSGQRSYYAVRVLSQCGFDAKNITGGFLTRLLTKDRQ